MKISLILMPLLFLSSCTIDWNGEKDKKIAELKKQVIELKEKNDDESFKKKQECIQEAAKIQQNNVRFNEIFFSQKRNSCVVSYQLNV